MIASYIWYYTEPRPEPGFGGFEEASGQNRHRIWDHRTPPPPSVERSERQGKSTDPIEMASEPAMLPLRVTGVLVLRGINDLERDLQKGRIAALLYRAYLDLEFQLVGHCWLIR